MSELPRLWGDGIHDDREAIQARIDRGMPLDGLPGARYRVEHQPGDNVALHVPENASFRGSCRVVVVRKRWWRRDSTSIRKAMTKASTVYFPEGTYNTTRHWWQRLRRHQ